MDRKRRKDRARYNARMSLIERLRSNAHREGDCLINDRAASEDGYSKIMISGESKYCHRAMWEESNGESIPEGMMVLHSCHDPRCIEPSHLRIGTHADNMRDKTEAGRLPSRWRHLRDDVVAEILALRASGRSSADVGRQYGIDRERVAKIWSGKTYAHITAAHAA